MNVLAVGCHPDDLEIMCAGTLAKYAARGDKVFMCVVANGNVGHRTIGKEEIARIRAAEAKASADIIGAELIMLDVDDLFVRSNDMEQRRKLVDVIRFAKPDVIITQPPQDYMDDHEETSRLVYEASMAATVGHYPTEYPFYEKLTPIYYMEPLWCVNSLPEEYVDITDVIDIKTQMLACHESQHAWLREHDGLDVVQDMRVMNRFRGIQCCTGYAEGFTSMRQMHKLTTKRLLP